MKTKLFWVGLLLLAIVCGYYLLDEEASNTKKIKRPSARARAAIANLHKRLKLGGRLSLEALEIGVVGMEVIGGWGRADRIAIVDFSKGSDVERFFVIDLKAERLLYAGLVAHGQGSGGRQARNFSNISESKQSSLGFYRTAERYEGKHGLSMRLDGLEAGINDGARSRAIVLHGADYVSRGHVRKHGMLGRSWGCPALAMEDVGRVMDWLEGGCCLYIYAADNRYFRASRYVWGR